MALMPNLSEAAASFGVTAPSFPSLVSTPNSLSFPRTLSRPLASADGLAAALEDVTAADAATVAEEGSPGEGVFFAGVEKGEVDVDGNIPPAEVIGVGE